MSNAHCGPCPEWSIFYTRSYFIFMYNSTSEVLVEETGLFEKFGTLPKVTPLVSSDWGFKPWQTSSNCSQKIPGTCIHPHLESGLLDFPDEPRQFYRLYSCPGYLYRKGCQISHPVFGPVLYLFYWEGTCIQPHVVKPELCNSSPKVFTLANFPAFFRQSGSSHFSL